MPEKATGKPLLLRTSERKTKKKAADASSPGKKCMHIPVDLSSRPFADALVGAPHPRRAKPKRQLLRGGARRVEIRQLRDVEERPGSLHGFAHAVIVLVHVGLEQMRKLDELLVVRRGVSPGPPRRQD